MDEKAEEVEEVELEEEVEMVVEATATSRDGEENSVREGVVLLQSTYRHPCRRP